MGDSILEGRGRGGGGSDRSETYISISKVNMLSPARVFLQLDVFDVGCMTNQYMTLRFPDGEARARKLGRLLTVF